MSYANKASADSDFSASFPHDGDMGLRTKAPLPQSKGITQSIEWRIATLIIFVYPTATDDAGDMTGHEHFATRKQANRNAMGMYIAAGIPIHVVASYRNTYAPCIYAVHTILE